MVTPYLIFNLYNKDFLNDYLLKDKNKPDKKSQ